MGEFRIGADGGQLGTHLLEAILQPCQGRESSRSDEGEVGGIEEEDRPLLVRLSAREAEFTKIAGLRVIGFEAEIRDCRPDLNGF